MLLKLHKRLRKGIRATRKELELYEDTVLFLVYHYYDQHLKKDILNPKKGQTYEYFKEFSHYWRLLFDIPGYDLPKKSEAAHIFACIFQVRRAFSQQGSALVCGVRRGHACLRDVVFEGISAATDPLERIQILIENDIKNKLGNQVFEGGCFFHSMLVELSGQSAALSSHLMRGFDQLAGLLCAWLKQADRQGQLKENLNFDAIARYIIVALNGAAALHACSRDPAILDQTVNELRFYIQQLQQ